MFQIVKTRHHRFEQLCTLLQHLSAEPFGLSRHPHPLAVVQSNTFILLFLMLHKDSHLFSEIENNKALLEKYNKVFD